MDYGLWIMDYGFTISLATKFKFEFLAEPIYVYRRHDTNSSNAHDKVLLSNQQTLRRFGMKFIRNAVMASSGTEEEKALLLAKIMLRLDEYKKSLEILQSCKYPTNDDQLNFYTATCHYLLLTRLDIRLSYF